MKVPEAGLLERAQRIALLGEEKIVGLDALERNHHQRVVGEHVDHAGADSPAKAFDDLGPERPALDDQRQLRAPRTSGALEPPGDPPLIEGLARRVLVEDVLAPVGERAHVVAEGGELLGEVDAHVPRPVERQHDQPAHTR
jgi:hypothetical protein